MRVFILTCFSFCFLSFIYPSIMLQQIVSEKFPMRDLCRPDEIPVVESARGFISILVFWMIPLFARDPILNFFVRLLESIAWSSVSQRIVRFIPAPFFRYGNLPVAILASYMLNLLHYGTRDILSWYIPCFKSSYVYPLGWEYVIMKKGMINYLWIVSIINMYYTNMVVAVAKITFMNTGRWVYDHYPLYINHYEIFCLIFITGLLEFIERVAFNSV